MIHLNHKEESSVIHLAILLSQLHQEVAQGQRGEHKTQAEAMTMTMEDLIHGVLHQCTTEIGIETEVVHHLKCQHTIHGNKWQVTTILMIHGETEIAAHHSTSQDHLSGTKDHHHLVIVIIVVLLLVVSVLVQIVIEDVVMTLGVKWKRCAIS
jgi:hypothetical protein